MGNTMVKNLMIDPETGEVLKENKYFSYDGFNDKGYKYRYRGSYIRYYWDSVPSNLSADALFLLFMLAEMANGDNALVYRVTRKSKFSNIVFKPLDKDMIRERLRYKMGRNKFERCWRELRSRCIKKVDYETCKAWVINPAFVSNCKEIPPWLYKEFELDLNPNMTKLAITKMKNLVKLDEELED